MNAGERRERIVGILSSSTQPVTGTSLASVLGVTRQVIVQDVAVLRARGEKILATPKGYTYWTDPGKTGIVKMIAVKHDFCDTEEELLTMVDSGVEVIDVIVEHPVYGQLVGLLSLTTPKDVEEFMRTIEETQAGLLSSLTDGVHLHTVRAPSKEHIDNLEKTLAEKGLLISD